jgi:hypothetical protein
MCCQLACDGNMKSAVVSIASLNGTKLPTYLVRCADNLLKLLMLLFKSIKDI